MKTLKAKKMQCNDYNILVSRNYLISVHNDLTRIIDRLYNTGYCYEEIKEIRKQVKKQVAYFETMQ